MVRSSNLKPTHPGEVLREDVLPALNMSRTAFAQHLKVSRQTVYDLLREAQPVTPQMALRLGKLLGNGPGIWIRLQTNYDLAVQAAEMAPVLDQIETVAA